MNYYSADQFQESIQMELLKLIKFVKKNNFFAVGSYWSL